MHSNYFLYIGLYALSPKTLLSASESIKTQRYESETVVFHWQLYAPSSRNLLSTNYLSLLTESRSVATTRPMTSPTSLFSNIVQLYTVSLNTGSLSLMSKTVTWISAVDERTGWPISLQMTTRRCRSCSSRSNTPGPVVICDTPPDYTDRLTQVFSKTVSDSNNVLHTLLLLPPLSTASQHYNLRRRTHTHSLLRHDSYLINNNNNRFI